MVYWSFSPLTTANMLVTVVSMGNLVNEELSGIKTATNPSVGSIFSSPNGQNTIQAETQIVTSTRQFGPPLLSTRTNPASEQRVSSRETGQPSVRSGAASISLESTSSALQESTLKKGWRISIYFFLICYHRYMASEKIPCGQRISVGENVQEKY